MIQIEDSEKKFVGYEYKEVSADNRNFSMLLDCYENFGWVEDEKASCGQTGHRASVRLKRDRKIINRMELTRLQRHFEACVEELEVLEQSKTTTATIWALVIGVLGTAFMAGSTFAVTHEPPVIWLCILLAVPGFCGWILPYFIYQKVVRYKTKKMTPLVEAKYDEIYEICEKGSSLL